MKTSILGRATEKNREREMGQEQETVTGKVIGNGYRKQLRNGTGGGGGGGGEGNGNLCKTCTGRDELKLSVIFFMKGLTSRTKTNWEGGHLWGISAPTYLCHSTCTKEAVLCKRRD